MRKLAGWLGGMLLCWTGPQPLAAPATDAGAQSEVLAVVGQLVDAWNRHDMDAFANLFADDADFVNVRGARWLGRTAIREAHAAVHATIFKQSRLHALETSVRFLKPDVAVARSVTDVTGQTDAAGHELAPRDTLLTLVMLRSAGHWLIVVAQNTDIAAASAAPTR